MSQEVDLADLERYLRIYQENPDSRVFAPLADMYRRLARFREAEQVSREGLLRHPYYAGGKVALAHILLDTERLQEALDIIEEVVTFYPDNLLARRILIKTLAGLNYWDRAEREFVAFRAMAPGMGEDTELAKILASKQTQQSHAALRSAATGERPPPRRPFPKGGVPNKALREANSMDEEQKLLLLKKKHVLESWLKSLEAGRV